MIYLRPTVHTAGSPAIRIHFARVEINGNINFQNLRNVAVAEMSVKNRFHNNAGQEERIVNHPILKVRQNTVTINNTRMSVILHNIINEWLMSFSRCAHFREVHSATRRIVVRSGSRLRVSGFNGLL